MNQSSLLLYWQSVIVQSSITNLRNMQAQSCMQPLNSWAVCYKNTPLPKDCRFSYLHVPYLHLSCGRCGSSIFLQISEVPYKSWAEPQTLETVVSLPRSVQLQLFTLLQ